jgi:hypothetical protein
MFKQAILVLLCVGCLFFSATTTSANIVQFNLANMGDLEISGFQLFFFEPDGTYAYPVDVNYDTFEEDFEFEWGPGQTRESFWSLESLILIDENIDFAKGIGGVASQLNTALKLNEGLILTMSSNDSYFGIDVDNISMAFFDFNGTEGENITSMLRFDVVWEGDKQVVTASAVPIPPAVLLFGSGIIGMLGLRRKLSK